MNAAPVIASAFGFVSVMVRVETRSSTIDAGAKAFATVGATSGAAVTSSVAVLDATAFAGAFAYAIVFSVEGIGLLLGSRWAEWLTVVSTGLLIPFEIYEVFHKPGFRTVPKESFPLKVWADCRSCAKLHACDEIAVARDV